MKGLLTLALLATAANADPIGYQYTPCGDIGQQDCTVTPSSDYPNPDPNTLETALSTYFGDSGVYLNSASEKTNANGITIGEVSANGDLHYFIDARGAIICCIASDSWLWIRGVNDHNLISGGIGTPGSLDHWEQVPFIGAVSTVPFYPGGFPPIYGLPDGISIFDINILANGLGADDSLLIMANSSSGVALLEPLYASVPITATDLISTPEPASFWLLAVVSLLLAGLLVGGKDA
jgi:hypothetical protein